MKVQKTHLLLSLLFIILSSTSLQSMRVVGYVTGWSLNNHINDIDYCKLSVLNVSFANPNSNADFTISDVTNLSGKLNQIRSINPDLKIYIAIAGATASQDPLKSIWLDLIERPEGRQQLTENIIQLVEDNGFDGVDVDLEWNVVTQGYNPFIINLAAALKARGLGITAALPNETAFAANSQALNAFDWINIMSYDATGPWNPTNPGPHSSYQFSIDGIDYWKNIKNIIGSQLTLGVPFYGHRFGSQPQSFTYASMVNQNILYADVDSVSTSYYNGRPTIRQKVELANTEELSGIMIWQLGQDSFTDYSLLTTIDNKIKGLGMITENSCDVALNTTSHNSETAINVYSIAGNQLIIEGETINTASILLFNTTGKKMVIKTSKLDKRIKINTSGFNKGIYLLHININGTLLTEKVLVK